MKKYYKTDVFRKKDKSLTIYFNWYNTKKGMLKFHIEIYAELTYNDSGFCTCVASYNTDDNVLLRYIKLHPDFEQI